MKKTIFIYLILSACSSQQLHNEYYSNKILKQRYTTRNGKFDGRIEMFFPDGRMEGEGEFDDGIKVKEWRYYYNNGKIKSIEQYDNGELVNINITGNNGERLVKDGTGTAILFYPNGDTMSLSNFINNRQDGRHAVWYKNGQIEMECFYNSGKLVGLYRRWNETGELIESKLME